MGMGRAPPHGAAKAGRLGIHSHAGINIFDPARIDDAMTQAARAG